MKNITAKLPGSIPDQPQAKERKPSSQTESQTAAEVMIGLAEELELFHTSSEVPYAVIPANSHQEVWSLRSETFKTWLRAKYFAFTGRGAPSESLKTALGTLEAKARFEGDKREVHTRIAAFDDRIYLDLGDEHWRVVEIDSLGWRIVTDPPVHFRRAPGLLALPEPMRGGSIDALRPFLNLRHQEDFVLIICWLLGCLRGNAPFPLLVLIGEQGSAKSTLSRILRRLVDPNEAPLRALPKNERDLFISASNAYVLAYDNLSGLQAGISDLLCTLSTGGGFSTRQLYTDEGEAIFKAARPMLLNGIDDVVRRPDLADRAIFVSLEPIPDEGRRTEQELWAAFDAVAPLVVGSLLDGVVTGLKRQAQVRLPRLPRMADFAIWSTAAETTYWSSGTFWAAYEANRIQAIEEVVDGDLVAAAVMKLIAKCYNWSGTASQLLNALQREDATAAGSKEWPKDPRALSNRLTRVNTFLRKLGVECSRHREGHNRTRMISLRKVDPPTKPSESEGDASATSTASAATEKSHLYKTAAATEQRTQHSPADDSWHAAGDVVRDNPLKYKVADDADAADANFAETVDAEVDLDMEWSAEL